MSASEWFGYAVHVSKLSWWEEQARWKRALPLTFPHRRLCSGCICQTRVSWKQMAWECHLFVSYEWWAMPDSDQATEHSRTTASQKEYQGKWQKLLWPLGYCFSGCVIFFVVLQNLRLMSDKTIITLLWTESKCSLEKHKKKLKVWNVNIPSLQSTG